MSRLIHCFVFCLFGLLLFTDHAGAQYVGGSGAIGYQLDQYGRLRVGPYPYAAGTREYDRISLVVGLSSTDVFDYNNDADNASFLPQKVVVAKVDSAAKTIINNGYSLLPPKIHVDVNVYTWKNAKYVVKHYRIYNDSSAALVLYPGMLALPQPGGSYGGETVTYSTAKNAVYFYRTASAYSAQKLLNKSAAGVRFMDWDSYSTDPINEVTTDAIRFTMSSYTQFDAGITAGGNGSVVQINSGQVTVNPGQSTDLYYGIAFGSTDVEALAWIDSAQTRYGLMTTSVNQFSEIPTEFTLSQNYPNPFNPTTTISFSLSQEQSVVLTVHDALGREVRTLVKENLAAGSYSVPFNATQLTSGIYYYTLQAGTLRETNRMVLLK